MVGAEGTVFEMGLMSACHLHLPHTSCVSGGTYLHLSEPWLPHPPIASAVGSTTSNIIACVQIKTVPSPHLLGKQGVWPLIPGVGGGVGLGDSGEQEAA